MANKMDFHVDTSVIGMSMLTISPGIGSLGSKPKSDPEDIVRALFETVFIGVAASMATRSWVPLAAPLTYLAFQHLWEHSGIAKQINMAAAEPVSEANPYGY